MELQLGLSISSFKMQGGFDLNCHDYEQFNNNNKTVLFGCTTEKMMIDKKKKRLFDEAFGENDDDDRVPHTLSLFRKDMNRDDDDDDDNDGVKNVNHQTNKSTEGDESSVIGWPPIKSWRKKQCYQNNRTVEINRQFRRGSSNSTYVKVKMEGVGIARKVDLSLYHSYQTLTNTLIPMFGKCLENVKSYTLTYQDKEGDWLLAGDLPWGTFKRSVQRLKLLKNDG